MKKFCPQCGAECDDSIKFCGKCGFNIAAYATVPQGQQQSEVQAAMPSNMSPVYELESEPTVMLDDNNVPMYGYGATAGVAVDNNAPMYGYENGQAMMPNDMSPVCELESEPTVTLDNNAPMYDYGTASTVVTDNSAPMYNYEEVQAAMPNNMSPVYELESEPTVTLDNKAPMYGYADAPIAIPDGNGTEADNKKDGKKNKKEKKAKKEKKVKSNKIGKNGKKKRLPWILRFLIANAIIAATLFVLWWSFGNMITLQLHTDKVVETLNSGSLELEGMENAYDELPDYIKDMMDDSSFENDYGPITKAMLPYISVERVKINGFFNGSTVEYKITAPDLEEWLLNLDATQIKSENDLLAKMQEYILTAPERSVNVTITYSRKNLFSINWRGNYYTREFSDAICGGFNSAYNVLYEQAMKELMEALEI